MSRFSLGKPYTRDEIHAAVGGGVQDYLPHVNKRVVAGCFDPTLNPDAPDVVLPGRGGPEIERWAKQFARQRDAIPCFLKRSANAWEFVGDFRFKELSEEPTTIARYAAETGRHDVSMVLFLAEA